MMVGMVKKGGWGNGLESKDLQGA
ncbi:MAG: hypothetical protein JWO94_421, partial [Verrucomicrobiaceae bacterium]|nr:hypothetical protein [Verrucomicrobiaceae bacterium]